MRKVVIMMIVFFICFFAIQNTICMATFTDPLEDPEHYQPSENPTSNNTAFIERANIAIGVIQLIGTLLSVVTFMVLGIRYMLASVQEKALYKETMGPYIVGAIMLFAIPNLISVLYDLITKNITR